MRSIPLLVFALPKGTKVTAMAANPRKSMSAPSPGAGVPRTSMPMKAAHPPKK